VTENAALALLDLRRNSNESPSVLFGRTKVQTAGEAANAVKTWKGLSGKSLGEKSGFSLTACEEDKKGGNLGLCSGLDPKCGTADGVKMKQSGSVAHATELEDVAQSSDGRGLEFDALVAEHQNVQAGKNTEAAEENNAALATGEAEQKAFVEQMLALAETIDREAESWNLHLQSENPVTAEGGPEKRKGSRGRGKRGRKRKLDAQSNALERSKKSLRSEPRQSRKRLEGMLELEEEHFEEQPQRRKKERIGRKAGAETKNKGTKRGAAGGKRKSTETEDSRSPKDGRSGEPRSAQQVRGEAHVF
jgi:hypothetical protein